MKNLTYSTIINKPKDVVFTTMIDKSVYPQWAKAWGEGMAIAGEWKEGAHISFFDHAHGGTKVIIEELTPHDVIKMKHIAMVNLQNIEIEPTDDAMRKWIGSQEEYYFKERGKNQTLVEIIMITDEMFEKMMEAWPKALHYFKEVCES